MAESITDRAWNKILETHPGIISAACEGVVYKLSADSIKEFREPRLMTKHDTSQSVPSPLKNNDLNVIALGGSPYEFAIGRFELFEEFPDMAGIRPQMISLPDYETLAAENITSESNAINALIISQALDVFLGEEPGSTVETFNGRMGSGAFSFFVNGKDGKRYPIDVKGAQLEIDGGFENDNSVIIMEAKNVIHDDFNVRQLYYPFRRYHAFVKKPIRLVFSQFTNLTYHLYEYEFTDPTDYSSLNLINRASYTFEDSRISSSELWELYQSTQVLFDDNMESADVPFIQADRFDRVIALMERMQDEPDGISTDDVVSFLGTVFRQGPYYISAGKYLGLFKKGPRRGTTVLTKTGQEILAMCYRDRQLAFARLMFQHEILNYFFGLSFITGQLPSRDSVIKKMEELNVCNPGKKGSMFTRRASSVLGWLRWLMAIPDEE